MEDLGLIQSCISLLRSIADLVEEVSTATVAKVVEDVLDLAAELASKMGHPRLSGALRLGANVSGCVAKAYNLPEEEKKRIKEIKEQLDEQQKILQQTRMRRAVAFTSAQSGGLQITAQSGGLRTRARLQAEDIRQAARNLEKQLYE